MADKILHKRSSTTGSIPTTSSLELGELALNTADGKIFLKKSGSAGESIQSAVTTDSITYGDITISGSLVLTASSQPLVDTNILDVTADSINFDFDTLDFTGSLLVSGSTTMSGSLTVTEGITGSLFGTSSFANTASFVNPLTQSVLISGSLTVTGSTTITGTQVASSGIGRTMLITSSISASANNDVLVGLDINPTFTTGAFPSVVRNSLRIQGNNGGSYPLLSILMPNNTTSTWLAVRNKDNYLVGTVAAEFGVVGAAGSFFTGTVQEDIFFKAYSQAGTSRFFIGATSGNSAQIVLFPSTNNVAIGTTTDAGFRLDVNGIGRFSGNLTITGSATNSLLVKGSGTTSATTGLLVQDSGNNNNFRVLDDGYVISRGPITVGSQINQASGNENLVLFRSQSNTRFVLGNPASSQRNEIRLNNSLGGYIASTGDLLFATNNINRLRIDRISGNVLINTTESGDFKLDVSGSGRFTDGLTVTGSLIASSITGSLFGTSSFAETASYVESAISASFASTASFVNPLQQNVQVTGSVSISASFSTSSAALSIYKSGSTVLNVEGSSGQLFSITDSLTGSLFSVNTVAGLPVIEAFSDNTVNIGKFGVYPIKVFATGTLASVTGSFTGSFVGSLVGSATSASFATSALTASYVNPLTQSVFITGSVSINTTSSKFDLTIKDSGRIGSDFASDSFIQFGNAIAISPGYNTYTLRNLAVGVGDVAARLGVRGSGTTSGTTALLVQNSNTSASLEVKDDRSVTAYSLTSSLGALINSMYVGQGSGNQNVYIGPGVGGVTNTGSGAMDQNVFIGQGAGTNFQNNSNGHVAIGFLALKGGNNSEYNVAIGMQSLANFIGQYNVAIGKDSGYDNTTGGFNTFVGFSTGRGITTGNSNTIIGSQVGGLASSLSNTVIISDGVGSIRFYSPSSGNVGLGTTSPNYKLDVSGSGNFTDGLTVTGSLTISGSSTLTNIGPTVLSGSLAVTGSTTTQGNMTVNGTHNINGQANIDIGGNHFRLTGAVGGQITYGYASYFGTYYFAGWTASSSTNVGLQSGLTGRLFLGNGDNPDLMIYDNKISIGSFNTPTAKLQIRGSGTTSATTALRVENANASASLVVLDNGFVGINTGSAGAYLDISATGGTAGLRVTHTDNNFVTFTRGANSIYFGTNSNIWQFTTVLPSTLGSATPIIGISGKTVGINQNPTSGFTLSISGSQFIQTGSLAIGTTSTGSALTVYKSGSTVVSIQGSQGELFSITDSLSGSLFSVSNISGLPILEVFSDNTTLIGNYLDPMLVTTQLVTANSGSTTIYSLPTASYDGAFYDYVVRSGSNARAGHIMAIWSGSSVNYTDNSTTDFGSTTNLSFNLIISGSNMVLLSTVTTGSWTVKTVIRSI